MSLLDRIKWNDNALIRPAEVALKEFDPGHPSSTSSLWWWSPAKDLADLNRVRDGSSNSIVVASLNALTSGFTEAVPRVEEDLGDGQAEFIYDHPAAELLENPNPFMTGDLLWDYYIWASRVEGNAYLFKQRSASGEPVELWPLRPDLTDPEIPSDPRVFVERYLYRPDGRQMRLEAEDVIHMRLGLEPKNYRKGRAPLKVVLNEILADEAAAQFTTALLSNMAIPGVIIGPQAGEAFDGSEGVEKLWKDKFGGGRRGEPLVLNAPTEIKVVSFSPEEMSFEVLRKVPEERVTAVLGVPAILAGMGAGIESSSGKSEGVALIEMFTEKTLIPDWRRVERFLTNGLLRDFDDNPNRRIVFDTTDVRSLQEDQNAIYERADAAVRGGWLMVSEAKRMVGLEPAENDDVYLRSISTQEVPGQIGIRQIPAESNGSGRVSEFV